MPTFVVHTPVGVNQIGDQGARSARPSPRPPAWASCARIRWIRSPARTAATTWAPETPVIHFEQWEAGRDRSEADPERRRLREQEYPVFPALRAGASGPRRPQSGRRAQVPAARRVAGAGPGLRAGRAGRLHRQRSRAWLRSGQGPAVPHARRCESESRCWRSWKREIMEEANRLGVGAMGFGGKASR